MANPSAVTRLPAVIQATTTEQSLTLSPRVEYHIGHNGKDISGNASVGDIYMSFSATVDADASEGADKAILQSDRPFTILGAETLKFKTASGSPTFQLIPGRFYPCTA